MDCGCIGLVEFDTPVFGRPFVLPRWRLYWLREEFGTPSGLEILLDEGGDVKLGARTSKHILLFVFKRVGKIKKRRSLWDWFLIFVFISILEAFPRVFLCVFDLQTLYFSHTLAYHIYLSIGSFLVRKIDL